MGRPRILGRSARISVAGQGGAPSVVVGEVDRFSVRNLNELKKSCPLGETEYAAVILHEGFDLEFEGGKVNWSLANLTFGQDEQIRAGLRSPYFEVTSTINFADGTHIEEYVYEDVTLHGYNFDNPSSGDEVKEKFAGFAAARRLGSGDNVTAHFDGASDIVSKIVTMLNN